MKFTLSTNFTFLFVLLFTSFSYSQTSEQATPNDWHSENSVDGIVTISKSKNKPQVVHNKAFYESEVVRIDNHIASINYKIETVNSDQKLKAEAIETDWFENMSQIKGELEAQKLEIQDRLNQIENK